MNQKRCILLLLLTTNITAVAQSVTLPTGVKVMVVQKDFPLLKILLPGQSTNDRGIEIEFPEHVTGLNKTSNKVEHLYLVTNGDRNKRSLPVWRVQGNSLIYETELEGKIKMTATARLEADGLRYTYTLSNHSNLTYQNLQAVTCVKLYSLFSDTLLERTYVHHTNGFDLLASETPERLTMPLRQWIPCRYLVSYTWPVSSNRTEDGIKRYYKSRKADKPFIATLSHDKKWIAATYTKETGNLWTNPERSCQHADPAVDLNPGETKNLTLKTFIIKGGREQLLQFVNAEMQKN
ncbi:hypothetical protein [Chitinophaga niabensis]|uniref:Uncharacterized protein n=1 Tax=Chitinophaga niabensis TaxID=536979 RepID=A0A1N6K198_9BACT|nr:hypothetical protein [Chitinophaga niabensis]SIO50106.1 hypothetical protein SAMN04488055_4838 [Chitinophaga niabensis]